MDTSRLLRTTGTVIAAAGLLLSGCTSGGSGGPRAAALPSAAWAFMVVFMVVHQHMADQIRVVHLHHRAPQNLERHHVAVKPRIIRQKP